jgi:hypothetical protein
MSKVVPAERVQNSQVQCAFLDQLHAAIPADKQVTIVTDAGFRTDWFRHIHQLGWNFTGRVRGLVSFRLEGERQWLKISDLQAEAHAVKVGSGVLARKPKKACYGSFYLQKRQSAGRHGKGGMPKTNREHRSSALTPWLLFSNVKDGDPEQIMKLYSRRMQIEQNFRDEKNPRLGYGFRYSRSQSKNRLEVLSVVMAMASLAMWLTGYMAERKQLHRTYQANTTVNRRVLSFLSLAAGILRHDPGRAKRMNLNKALKTLGKDYTNLVMCS